MTVERMRDVMQKLVEKGYGDLDLFGVASSSGVSYDISAYDWEPEEVNENDDAGPLCDLELGTKYMRICLG